MTTSRITRFGLLVVLVIAAAGCRQADGPLPVAEGDRPNQIGDLGRDLTSIARGEVQARADLADDLRVFLDVFPAAVPASAELARRTSEVVAGRAVTEQNVQRLAHQLWMAAAARELSERQVESLQNDMQALLVSIGATESSAQAVAAQIAEVQKAVTSRQRRWYEVF